jgi:hypothetical protein
VNLLLIEPVQLPMKTLTALAAAFVSLVLALPALGQQADNDRIKAELKKKLPEAPVESVRKIPYGGLYEVIVGNDVFYTDGQTSFLVIGQLVDLRTKDNINASSTRSISPTCRSIRPSRSCAATARARLRSSKTPIAAIASVSSVTSPA